MPETPVPIPTTRPEACVASPDVTVPLPANVALSQGHALLLSPPRPGEEAHPTRQIVSECATFIGTMLLEPGQGQTMPDCLDRVHSLCVLRSGLVEDLPPTANPQNGALVPAAGKALCRTARELEEADAMKVNVEQVEHDIRQYEFFDQIERSVAWFLTIIKNNKAFKLQRIDQAVRDGLARIESQLPYNPRLRGSLESAIALVGRNAQLAAETTRDRNKVRAEVQPSPPPPATPPPVTPTFIVSATPPPSLPVGPAPDTAGGAPPPPAGRSSRR